MVPMSAPVSLPPPPLLLVLSDAAVVWGDPPEVVVVEDPLDDEPLELYTDCILVCPPHVASVGPEVV
jgi:hypothetical protein